MNFFLFFDIPSDISPPVKPVIEELKNRMNFRV